MSSVSNVEYRGNHVFLAQCWCPLGEQAKGKPLCLAARVGPAGSSGWIVSLSLSWGLISP